MASEEPTSDAPDPAPAQPARPRRRLRRDPTNARRSAPSRARQWRERAHLPLAVCAVAAPLLFDGMFGWSMVSIAGLAALAAGGVWLAYRRELSAIPAPVPLVIAFAAFAWTVLSACPLPMFVVRVLAPASAEAVALTAHAAGTAVPSFCALSRDPGGTAMEIVKGAAIVAAFTTAWALANTGKREQLVRIAALSVVVVAAVGAAHLAIGETRVYGVYQPYWSSTTIPGPIVNGNHMGGFLAMGVPLMLLLGAETRLPAARIGWFGAAAGASLLTVWSISRGAIGSLIVGVVLLVALLGVIRNKRGDSARRRAVPWVAVGVSVALVLAGWVAADVFVETFRDHDLGKLRVAASSLRLALDAPLFGVGRGAFSAAFAALDGPEQRFVVPENLVAQWLTEWGIPMAVVLAATFGARLVSAMLVTRDVVRGAACAAVVSIVLHDMADFALERLGVAVVAAIALAAALAPAHEREPVPPDRGRLWPSMASLLLAGAVVGVLAGGGLAHRVHRTSVLELQERLQHASDRHDDATFAPLLRRAVELHPSEPAFALLAGAEAAARGDRGAGRWLTRAMQLAPSWESPHEVAAGWLWRSGRQGQALLELREAAERQPGRAAAAGCEIAQATHDARVVLRAAPTGPTRIVFLDAIAQCLPPAQAELIDRDLLAHTPRLVSAVERQAMRDVAAGRAAAAVTAMAAVVHRTPTDPEAQTVYARTLVAAGRPHEGAAALATAAAHADDPIPLLEEEARILGGSGDETGMRRTVEQLRGLAGGSSAKLGAAMMLLGQIEESNGNVNRALHAYDEAHRFDPQSGGLGRVAALSERQGDLRGAFHAYAELCDTEGPASAACTARDRLAGTGAEPALPFEQPMPTGSGPGGAAVP